MDIENAIAASLSGVSTEGEVRCESGGMARPKQADVYFIPIDKEGVYYPISYLLLPIIITYPHMYHIINYVIFPHMLY